MKKLVKRNSVLKKQIIKKKKLQNGLPVWRVLRQIWSFTYKSTLLLASLVILSLVFISLYQYLLTSPYIQLKEVVVSGVSKEIKDDLVKMSKLNNDMSLLAVNIRELKITLEKHSWVRTINIKKQFPHSLIIEAEMEIPKALVLHNGFHYMNQWGSVFKKVEPNEKIDFPIITGVVEENRFNDEKLQLAANVLKTLGSEKGPWSLGDLSEINLTQEGDISMYSVSYAAVIKLKGSELANKKAELKKIVNHLKKKGIIHSVKTIDLNYNNGAVVSFKRG